MSVDLRVGDCRDVLKELPDNSVDSIVTDPPYELGFMGKKWDSSGIAYDPAVWAECLRVLKPGGYLLAFGGTRTYHRMTCAIEDAGFEIRDCIQWLYSAGFPKSLDISKAMDKAAGSAPESPNRGMWHAGSQGAGPTHLNGWGNGVKSFDWEPVTPEAKQWTGWGTALKPANEPIVVARKPLSGTVAENVQQWGVGGLNIDASRIPTTDDLSGGSYGGSFIASRDEHGNLPKAIGSGDKGRWPANIIFDEEAADLLDVQSGITKSSSRVGKRSGKSKGTYGDYAGQESVTMGHNDSGGASRFFYVAKTSVKEREAGLDRLPQVDESRKEGNPGGDNPRNRGVTKRANSHPTVKPITLMQYLVRLVTPPSGVVLDPFMGSGSTGCAAVIEDFSFIGVDNNPEYVIIAKERIQYWTPLDI